MAEQEAAMELAELEMAAEEEAMALAEREMAEQEAAMELAEQEMAETGERWCLSEWHRVHAMAHHSMGKKEHTEKIFEEAANVAEQQGATNWLDRVNSSREVLAG